MEVASEHPAEAAAALGGDAIDAAPAHLDERTGILIRSLGRTDYEACWRAMRVFTAARDAGTRDEIWLTEHLPVFTLGLAGRRVHLRDTRGIPVIKVDRGGQVTYHGPGQLVAYLMFDLRRGKLAIRTMVRSIEAAVVEFLDSIGVFAYGKPSAPGVYVAQRGIESKIAALGLKVSNGCTYHGLALNVTVDLAPFADIDPCGYPGLAVTSLEQQGVAMSVSAAGAALAPTLARYLSRAVPRLQ
jgi:lipoyl(octanoyl) transferase